MQAFKALFGGKSTKKWTEKDFAKFPPRDETAYKNRLIVVTKNKIWKSLSFFFSKFPNSNFVNLKEKTLFP